jgi:hypothetical protein
MKNELTVTFKRVTQDMVGKAVKKEAVVCYQFKGVINIITYDKGNYFDDEDIWYCPLSAFEPQPKTAEEYFKEWKETRCFFGYVQLDGPTIEEFAQYMLDQERRKDENTR